MLQVNRTHHALSCASCGAPLQQLKMLPVQRPEPHAVTHQPAPLYKKPRRIEARKRKPLRAGRFFRKLAEEAFDLVEDIFD